MAIAFGELLAHVPLKGIRSQLHSGRNDLPIPEDFKSVDPGPRPHASLPYPRRILAVFHFGPNNPAQKKDLGSALGAL